MQTIINFLLQTIPFLGLAILFIIGVFVYVFVQNKRWFHNLIYFFGLTSCVVMLLLACENHDQPDLIMIGVGTFVISLVIYLFGVLERKPTQSIFLSENKSISSGIHKDIPERRK